MFDIAFIIPINSVATDIGPVMKQLTLILKYSRNIEIIVINTAIEGSVNPVISEFEKDYPDNILIINTDEPMDIDSCIETGLSYSDCLCYTIIVTNAIFDTNDAINNISINENACDQDKLKYIKDKYTYIVQGYDKPSFRFDAANELPQLEDYKESAGSIDKHYFYQDIYVAGKLFDSKIPHVYDIGSRVDGYISHLLAMNINVTMIDIRPLSIPVNNLHFVKGNAMDLSSFKENSIPALSCLHALEHFGLGRYGDPIDHDGWKKALDGFKRIVASNGYLYLSVPVGKYETVMFNSHRIFNPMTIISYLSDAFKLMEFTLIHGGQLSTFDLESVSFNDLGTMFDEIRSRLIGYYDCGVFIFKKSI